MTFLSIDRATVTSVTSLQVIFSAVNSKLGIPLGSMIGSHHDEPAPNNAGTYLFRAKQAIEETKKLILSRQLPDAKLIVEDNETIVCFIFENGVILRFAYDEAYSASSNFVIIYDYNTRLSFATRLVEIMEKFYEVRPYRKPEPRSTAQFYLVYLDEYGFSLKEFPINDNLDKQLSRSEFNLHYSPDFTSAYEQMIRRLREGDGGLHLLHGVPGSGKSSVLIQMAHSLRFTDRKIIYFPPESIEMLGMPQFVPFMMQNVNSILLMEDIENILKVAEGEKRSKQTINLLNISDGVYARCYNVAVVGTFNCSRNDIDAALLRSSRLRFEWFFTELPTSQANDVLRHHGSDVVVDKPSALGDLFAIIKNKRILTNVTA